MAPNILSPVTLAADRARNSFNCRAALNSSEITPSHPKLQEIRAAFVARKCGVSREIAMIVAPLAFGQEVTS